LREEVALLLYNFLVVFFFIFGGGYFNFSILVVVVIGGEGVKAKQLEEERRVGAAEVDSIDGGPFAAIICLLTLAPGQGAAKVIINTLATNPSAFRGITVAPVHIAIPAATIVVPIVVIEVVIIETP
jgi:hypothetical protein